MFKNLIGQGHPEFSTKRQQDAQEFFLHLISVLEVIMSNNQYFKLICSASKVLNISIGTLIKTYYYL